MTKQKAKKFENLEKIVVNVGLGKLRNLGQFDEKIIPAVQEELSLITGQKAAIRKAKQSIAGFKTRTGDVVGMQVTIRGKRMTDFLNRIINVVFPRVKDFRGIDLKNIDEGGNLNIGFREQTVFPEIIADKSKVSFGFQVTLVPYIRKRAKAVELYRHLGLPLKGQKPIATSH